MKKKMLLVLVVLLFAAFGLFAAGAVEIADDETVVKVLSVSADVDGGYVYTVEDQEGTEIIYRANDESTTSSVPFDQIQEGSILAIRDNGIATMSIPAQMVAVRIRDLTLATRLGGYSFAFAEPSLSSVEEIVEREESETAEKTAATEFTPWTVSLDTVEERFSYAYGYNLVENYQAQGLVFRAAYFARGTLDFWDQVDTLIPIEEMSGYVNDYISTIYEMGLEENNGPAPSSLDDIYDITDFNDLSERFSYCYGYVSAFQDYYYGLMIDGENYVAGALSAMYGAEPLMSEGERLQANTDYVTKLQAEYENYLAELAENNLAAAEAFLAENALSASITTTDSGLQFEIVSEGDGDQPAADDIVIVSYTLRDIEGNIIETNSDIQFDLTGMIPGFSETVQNLRVGGEAIAYIHPSLAYGSSGAGVIEPNALLVFDIELKGIVEDTAAETAQ